MPTSNYEQFYVKKETSAGEIVYAGASISVKVRAEGAGSDLTTLTTDGNSKIVAGTLSVAAGTVVHFRIENQGGLAGTCSQTTT